MKNWISVTISVIAFVISIMALSIVKPSDYSCGGPDFDYVGAVIGVLSLLVTLLIGFQIYTMIDVRKELKELQSAKAEIDKSVDEKIQKERDYTTEELRNVIPLLLSIDMHDESEVISMSFHVFGKAEKDTLAYAISEYMIFTFMNKVAAYNDEQKEQFITKLKDKVEYRNVGEVYSRFNYLPDEQKKEYEGVEKLIVRLINLYIKA